MKRVMFVVFSLLLAPSLFADAGSRLIPAGSLVSCTTGDGKISSKTTAVGDPVLCKVEFRRGDFMLPYGSYLGGQFAEYKDPGHFVGKGWMELDFDRLYVGDTVVPINAKVVDVPGYKIDAQGRILGKGHAVRDTVLWMIPVLWPIDLINLPRRGPRPTLKSETTLTLRDDGRHSGSGGVRSRSAIRMDCTSAGRIRTRHSQRRRRSRRMRDRRTRMRLRSPHRKSSQRLR